MGPYMYSMKFNKLNVLMKGFLGAEIANKIFDGRGGDSIEQESMDAAQRKFCCHHASMNYK